jgi:mRNA interferase RelE/StbE
VGKYEILVRPSVGKDVRRIPKVDLMRILERIQALQNEPRPPGATKLSDQDYFRIRQGDYRVVYEVDDANSRVVVVKVGHRSDVYR